MCAFLRRLFRRRLVRGPRLLILAFFSFFLLYQKWVITSKMRRCRFVNFVIYYSLCIAGSKCWGVGANEQKNGLKVSRQITQCQSYIFRTHTYIFLIESVTLFALFESSFSIWLLTKSKWSQPKKRVSIFLVGKVIELSPTVRNNNSLFYSEVIDTLPNLLHVCILLYSDDWICVTVEIY